VIDLHDAFDFFWKNAAAMVKIMSIFPSAMEMRVHHCQLVM
jgi:hypothetical protein